MIENLSQLFSANGYLPHGYCINWPGPLLAAYAISDLLIFLAYFSIPVAIVCFARRRTDFPYKWLLWMFAAFILACGTIHLMDVVVLWQPLYGVQALLKVITAAISVITAFMLWPLIPRALKIAGQESLKEAQRLARMGSWTLDLGKGELVWSDEVFRLFEVDPSRFGATYEAFLNAIHPDDREMVDQAYTNSLLTRAPYEITHRLRMSDGRIKWVTERCKSYFDAAGKPLRSIGTVQDITELKLGELELIKVNSKLKSILDATPDLLFEMGLDGRYHDVHTSRPELLAPGADEFQGKTIFDLLPPDAAEICQAALREANETGSSRGKIFFLPLPDGGRWFELSVAPKHDGDDPEPRFVMISRDVTERKSAEIALNDAYDLLNTIINAAPIRVFWKDRDLRFMGCNSAFARDAGREQAGDLVGKDDYQMVWADQADRYRDDDRSIMASGVPKLAYEEPQTTPDGQTIWLRTSKVPLRNRDDETIGVIGLYEDITQQVAAREELRVRKEFFQRTFNDAPVGMAIADLNGRYICSNAAMSRMVGYSEEELKGMSYRDITHPDDLAENDRQRERLVHDELDRFEMEKRYVRKDGRVIWAIMVVSVIKGPDGKAMVSVGQMIDIDQLKRTEAELQKSEANLRSMMDNSPYLTWLKDTESRYVTINKVFADYLRLESPRQAVGKTDLDLQPRELAEKYRADDVEVMASRQRQHVEEPAFDGSKTHWVETFKTPIVDAQGKVLGTVGFARDVSERKRHEREVVRSREQLRALAAYHERILEEERKHIAREIHDELGQQLSALKLDIGLLRRNHGAIPEIIKLAQQMRETVDRSIDVVRQVSSNLRPAALDLGIVAAIEWLAGEFTSRWGIDCEIDSNGGDIALGDEQAIVVFRVIQESLTNVARHSRARHVSVVMRHRGGEFSLRIHDDGSGFDVAAASAKGGYGLIGMRERVLTLGGSIEFDTQFGAGTTVVITFPLAETQA